jgi:putative hydrolase of the HAD superfamily
MNQYRHLFFDLDNTLWNFSANSRSALYDTYDRFSLQRYYPDFEGYFANFEVNNAALWRLYGADKITKEFLSTERFLSPLRPFGILNASQANEMSAFYLQQCAEKTAVMPNAIELLEYLKPNYTLHIISNGFRELQYKKMSGSGLTPYFSGVFLSEEVGYHKPKPEFFDFAIRQTGAGKTESLVIGDNYEVDIAGAMAYGLDQAFYAPGPTGELPGMPTYIIGDLAELMKIL